MASLPAVTCDGTRTRVEAYIYSRHPLAPHDTALHEAAHAGDVAQLAAALPELDDIDLQNALGFSPLALAVHGNQPSAIRFLLSARANPNLAALNVGFDCVAELAALSASKSF